MSQFYIKYIPVRCGLTGYEYLAGWMDQNYSGVKFNPVISDGLAEFGILTGTGDILLKAMAACEGRFSAVRITVDVFIGVIAKYYNPPATNPDGSIPPTLAQFITNLGLTVPADTLVNVKTAKKQLLKEMAKKEFSDDNDTLADLSRIIVLLNLHYPTLTTTDKATVDALTTTIKGIYTVPLCITSLQNLTTQLQTTLTNYYTACTAVDAATTVALVDAVVMS